MNVHDPEELTDAALNRMSQMGVRYIRMTLSWSRIEVRHNRFNFAPYDQAFARLSKRRMRVIAVVGLGHKFYTGGDKRPPVTTTQLSPFLRFVRASTARYANKGFIWELWNEANYNLFWPGTDPIQYVNWARRVATTMRSIAPREWIIGVSGVFPLTSDDQWFPRAFNAGLLEFVDGISMHPYVAETQIPEEREASWRWLRDLITLYKPAGKEIPLLSTEGGFTRFDQTMTPVRRARETTRYVLHTLASGVGSVSIFNWQDYPEETPRNSQYGLITLAGQETPALHELIRVCGALRGWKFAKRLVTPNPDDYVLLFNRGEEVRLAVWTAAAPRNLVLDSSPGSMAIQSESNSGTLNVVNGQVTIPLGNDVRLVTPNGPNPLLIIAAQWTKAPTAAVIGSIADAKAAFENVVVSPAWQDAPVGTTLRVDDIPDDQPGYARAPYTRTLNPLAVLTPGSNPIQSLWNELPSVQDGTEGARTLRFTLTLPDGASVTQQTIVTPRNPLKVEFRAPSPSGFSVWVRNPSAKPFTGSIRATFPSGTVQTPMTFAQGESEREVVFTGTSPSIGAQGVSLALLSGMSGVRDPDLPVVATETICVDPLPNADFPGWIDQRDGPGLPLLSWIRSADSQITDPMDGNAIRFDYSVTSILNWACGRLVHPGAGFPVTQRQFALGMWVHGEGDRAQLTSTFRDANGEMWQTPSVPVDWTGWRWVTLRCDRFAMNWGGDGVVQTPLSLNYVLNVTPGQWATVPRSIRIQGITLLSRPNP